MAEVRQTYRERRSRPERSRPQLPSPNARSRNHAASVSVNAYLVLVKSDRRRIRRLVLVLKSLHIPSSSISPIVIIGMSIMPIEYDSNASEWFNFCRPASGR
jgi:hypothetical protein